MSAVMIQASDESAVGFKCYGAARELWRSHGPEVIISGPYETGKTYAGVQKLHTTLAKYPRAQGLMVRKTYKSLIASVVQTYEKKVLPYPPEDDRCAVAKFGKSKPEWYDYPNGSRLWLGGMDNPSKFLSSEFDVIYVNQAEELWLDDWEKLGGRATGRAGNMPYAMIFGDCNPDVGTHWIMQRVGLQVLHSVHRDNPVLFDPDSGEITEQGKRSMSFLKKLTGVRYKRGFQGLWVGSEGMVYEGWGQSIHMTDRFEVPADWKRYRCIDFGFRNPFVCSWWAEDPDGDLYRYREIYMTERTVKSHAEQINALSEGERYVATIADHDASDRATLLENGISTIAAKKDILNGIELVQHRLQIKGNGKPSIFFMRDSLVECDQSLKSRYKPTCTEEEFPGYVFPERKEGKADDEKPVKVDDHGMDVVRYLVSHVDNSTQFAMDWV